VFLCQCRMLPLTDTPCVPGPLLCPATAPTLLLQLCCLALQMTPGSHRLTPSLVRRHLQQAVKRAGGAGGRGLAALIQQLLQPTNNLGNSDMSSSTSVPPGGQKQPAVAAVAPPSPAAVLLEYCLSDAEPPSGSSQQQAAAHLTQLQGELEGLPLLPLADGTLGIISPSPPKRTSGASAQQQPQQQAQLPSSPCYILPASPQEQSLLAGTPGLVISPALPADLRARLQALAQQQGGVLNVQALSAAALNSLVLPRLLPPEWRGKEVVPWTPTQAGGGGGLHQAQLQGNAAPPGPAMPSAAASAASLTVPWLRQLWQWLGSHQGGAEVLGITDWPLLPLQGGRLAAIRSPSQVRSGVGGGCRPCFCCLSVKGSHLSRHL
jgi:sacsin